MVARTVTSLNRALDVLAVFADDLRVQVSFVVSRGSRFGAEVPRVLEELGARVIDWQQAVDERFDLVISASDHADLHELRGPLALFSHGAGFMKYSPHNDPTADERAGLTGAALWHEGHGVPHLLGLSHENQRELLGELADRAHVIGDPTLDSMMLLAERRDILRGQLGLSPTQRLVTLTSTWGPRSLLARRPTLPAQLLAELPWDEYRVAAVLHPNIWAAHGPWQIRHWLRTALSSGLILLPPAGPWQIGLAAADCVIGDHGSLSAYAAGLSRPLMLAAFGEEEVPRDTAMWRLSRRVPQLNPRLALAAQVRHAIDHVELDVLREAADDVFSEQGRSLGLLQRHLYDVLGLEPQYRPTPRDVPEWQTAPEPSAFHAVVAEVNGSDGRAVSVERFPAALLRLARPGLAHHLVARRDADEVTLQNAAAIITAGAEPGAAAQTLSRYPGCRLAVEGTAEAVVLTERDGTRIRVTGLEGPPPAAWTAASVWIHLRARTPGGARGALGDVQIAVGRARGRSRILLE
ncbi:hypothetical protein GCM10009745_63030 [Kribbella yunnanensis]|uniref:Uncharacterized protein n=1 Tax=Kribbella yunnanensis TaxID=190194 RepID=A0ABN2IKZ1_9ACTN